MFLKIENKKGTSPNTPLDERNEGLEEMFTRFSSILF
jgi:hypothetical protein